MSAGEEESIGFGAFRFAAQECMERLTICEVVGGLTSSFGEVEGTFARALAKVGKLNLDEQQTESMAAIVSGWAASVKAMTAAAGKQHASVAVVVEQEVSKALADVARLNSKRVQDIVQFVKVKNHEIARAKAAQQKLLDRYRKAVDDTESAIRQRDAAVLEEAKKALTSSSSQASSASRARTWHASWHRAGVASSCSPPRAASTTSTSTPCGTRASPARASPWSAVTPSWRPPSG